MQSNRASLYYLVGPSGAGKDTLLAALARDARRAGLRIARRYITRPPHPGDENHVELSPAEFERRQGAGKFLFAWQSHGFNYAIDRRVLAWLEQGEDVIVNGSRAYLQTALDIFPRLQPVWITVPEALLRERLTARGRETAAQIDARLRRNRELEASYRSRYACIDNDGSIADALSRFDALRRERRR